MRGICRKNVSAVALNPRTGFSRDDRGIHRWPSHFSRWKSPDFRKAFTLLEVLVSIAVLSLLLVVMASLANLTSNTSSRALAKLEAFESARAAFDTIARTLRQATLLSQITYNDPTAPTDFQLSSDLHFISGSQTDLGIPQVGSESSKGVFFQAPLGLAGSADLQSATSLLSCVGYFIAYGELPNRPAKLDGLTPDRYRYRLFQFLQPREEMTIYTKTITEKDGIPTANPDYDTTEWFSEDVGTMTNCRLLAENVIGLVLLPVFGDGSVPDSYLWNSRDSGSPKSLHRLPAALKFLLVAIDEKSAVRLGDSPSPPDIMSPDLFLDPREFDDDLVALKNRLNSVEPKINYEIFLTEVALTSGDLNL